MENHRIKRECFSHHCRSGMHKG
uniref:Uncharacterized protein n=1 Tax=Anguilla anguilla TaxID=7936 RepID=A0A0E9QCK2_ANGAN